MKKPFAITLDPGSSLANHTGTWRTERPVYVDRLPPCNHACPAGENIQGWLFHAESGEYRKAWESLMENNPFPAIMGRVCYHPCESSCNRGELDEAVGIHSVERFLGDLAIREGWIPEISTKNSGRRILVVGAGPSGLACAYHLRLMGHEVVVIESEKASGGMMRYGIPKYRLPRDVLDAEIARIVKMGVEIRLGEKVGDIMAVMEGFDAAFLAVGAHIARRTYIPAGDAAKILDAVSLLHDMEEDNPPFLGKKVAIYGGGNTAIDAARTAKRLGAEESLIVYRRTKEKMPAHASELNEAIEEGIRFKWLATVKEMGIEGIVVEKMILDETGFPQPTGTFENVEADCLILALGQESELSLLKGIPDLETAEGQVKVDVSMMTSRPGIFAGGDMIPSEKTVTTAVGHGKKAARNIDAWLNGEVFAKGEQHEIASFDKLNTWYYSDAPKTVQQELGIVRRHSTFDEVVKGLSEQNALFEARRCLSCGNCFECDNCYGVCPDNAVIKLGPGMRFEFNYDFCKGCGLCAAECPCGAILMMPESI
jgi:NADPH-dependent glutamate synthase beta subunit-like oxidoreductase